MSASLFGQGANLEPSVVTPPPVAPKPAIPAQPSAPIASSPLFSPASTAAPASATAQSTQSNGPAGLRAAPQKPDEKLSNQNTRISGEESKLCGEPPWLGVARRELQKGVARRGEAMDKRDAELAGLKKIKNPSDEQKKQIEALQKMEFQDNQDIMKYFSASSIPKPDDGEDTAWCGAFVAWVLKNTPQNPQDHEKSGASYKDGIPKESTAAKSWADYGQEAKRPKIYGAIVTRFKGGRIRHVTFVVGVRTAPTIDPKTKKPVINPGTGQPERHITHIIGLGGNQGDHRKVETHHQADDSLYNRISENELAISEITHFRFPNAWPEKCWSEPPERSAAALTRDH